MLRSLQSVAATAGESLDRLIPAAKVDRALDRASMLPVWPELHGLGR